MPPVTRPRVGKTAPQDSCCHHRNPLQNSRSWTQRLHQTEAPCPDDRGTDDAHHQHHQPSRLCDQLSRSSHQHGWLHQRGQPRHRPHQIRHQLDRPPNQYRQRARPAASMATFVAPTTLTGAMSRFGLPRAACATTPAVPTTPPNPTKPYRPHQSRDAASQPDRPNRVLPTSPVGPAPRPVPPGWLAIPAPPVPPDSPVHLAPPARRPLDHRQLRRSRAPITGAASASAEPTPPAEPTA